MPRAPVEGTSSADEFLDAALSWFGDSDPRIGTGWEKGERLAKLVANRRTLLVLDGLEPLQNPPGPQEGRLRDPSLQALLRDSIMRRNLDAGPLDSLSRLKRAAEERYTALQDFNS